MSPQSHRQEAKRPKQKPAPKGKPAPRSVAKRPAAKKASQKVVVKKTVSKKPLPKKTAAPKKAPAGRKPKSPKTARPSLSQKPAKKPVTAKIVKPSAPAAVAPKKTPKPVAETAAPKPSALAASGVTESTVGSASAAVKPPVGRTEKPKPLKTTLDDLALDIEEKDELLEEEKKDLVKVLREEEDEPLETAFIPTDTSERYILVVDEEGQRRNETMTIVSQILPNAVVEVADDPEEALEIMQEADFDTYVVNFLMPGYSASPFVKAVANHPDHPLLIGFAADKISDALDQKKGLKIIPLKRLFDLDVNTDSKEKADKDE